MATFTHKLVKKSNFKGASLIGLDKYNCRFCLDLEFNLNRHNVAIVILMNPSTTGKQHLFFNINLKDVTDVDATTRNVIRCLVKNQVRIKNKQSVSFDHLIILNLFPYYSSQPEQIYKIYRNSLEQTYQINMAVIRSIIDKYPKASYFLGWIKNNQLPFAEKDVENLLNLKNITPYYFDVINSEFDYYYFNAGLTMCHAINWN